MKKLFTLVAAMFCAVCVNAQTEVDIPIDNWGWGYDCTTTYEDGILTGTLTGSYGAVSTGWNGGTDWSKYGKLTVVIESYNNDWGKVSFKSETDDNTVEKSFSTITSTTNVTIDIDPTLPWISNVTQLSVQGKAADDVIKISRVYLTEAVEYETEGKEIAFDEWGNILASEFEGYSDKAKVVFTYNTTGELTNNDGSVVGWGTGEIKSIDGKVNVADVPVKALGDNEISFTLSELKDALASGPDEYNRYGLYWNMYPQGNSTSTRKSVVIYEVKSDPTGISDNIAAPKAENNVRYNLLGVKNGNGIYIQNGKKYMK